MFELDYNGSKVSVQEHQVAGQTVFRIAFSDRRQPLVITRAINNTYTDFWTSIPEGQQQEAEEIGKLISEHFNKKG